MTPDHAWRSRINEAWIIDASPRANERGGGYAPAGTCKQQKFEIRALKLTPASAHAPYTCLHCFTWFLLLLNCCMYLVCDVWSAKFTLDYASMPSSPLYELSVSLHNIECKTYQEHQVARPERNCTHTAAVSAHDLTQSRRYEMVTVTRL